MSILLTINVLVALLLSVLTAAQPDPGSCSSPDAQVLILGGGMAGISAANRLHQMGINNLIVLEATSKLGGRMRSEDLVPGVNVGVGANWIHGVDPAAPELHPLYALAQECGGLQGVSIFDDPIVSNRYDDYFSAVKTTELISINGQANRLPDISFRDALTRGNWMATTPEDDFIEWYYFDYCFAEPPDVLSLYGFTIGRATESDFLQKENNKPRDFYVTDQRRYPFLVDCLANNFSSGVDDDRIHLNTTVNRISYSDDCVCVDVLENGVEKQYCASYSIVTFSIGVLQSEIQTNTLFSPGLPMPKIEAINSISMNHFLLIYLVFEERFWDDVEYIGYASTTRGYYPLIQPLQRFLPNGLNAIAVTVTYNMADRVVRQDIAVTRGEIMEVLRTIYGNNISEPTTLLFNNWLEDPLFRGTYSNWPLGVTDQTYKELNSPEGRLYFSGEGTSARYYGYAHGALFSGIDAANLVRSEISSGVSLAACLKLMIFTSFVVIMNTIL